MFLISIESLDWMNYKFPRQGHPALSWMDMLFWVGSSNTYHPLPEQLPETLGNSPQFLWGYLPWSHTRKTAQRCWAEILSEINFFSNYQQAPRVQIQKLALSSCSPCCSLQQKQLKSEPGHLLTLPRFLRLSAAAFLWNLWHKPRASQVFSKNEINNLGSWSHWVSNYLISQWYLGVHRQCVNIKTRLCADRTLTYKKGQNGL